jgi:hypothetical protein
MKLKSAKPVVQWLYEWLADADEKNWAAVKAKSVLHAVYVEWCNKTHKSHVDTLALFSKELKKIRNYSARS